MVRKADMLQEDFSDNVWYSANWNMPSYLPESDGFIAEDYQSLADDIVQMIANNWCDDMSDEQYDEDVQPYLNIIANSDVSKQDLDVYIPALGYVFFIHKQHGQFPEDY